MSSIVEFFIAPDDDAAAAVADHGPDEVNEAEVFCAVVLPTPS